MSSFEVDGVVVLMRSSCDSNLRCSAQGGSKSLSLLLHGSLSRISISHITELLLRVVLLMLASAASSEERYIYLVDYYASSCLLATPHS